MTSDKAYRLGDCRITVYDDVLVRWERHVPLATARSGKCFLWGDILIIGNDFHDTDGFQIGEFLDHLRALPPWTRTRYYCFASRLLDTATGQNLTDESLGRVFSGFEANRTIHRFAEEAGSPGAYRLGHYQITVAADRRISWQAWGELNRIASGRSSVESGILVIGPQEHDEEKQDKQEFLDALARLPQWDKTPAWCRGPVLRLCRDTQQEKKIDLFGWFLDRAKVRPAEGESRQPLKEKRGSKLGSKFTPEFISIDAGGYGKTARMALLAGGHAMQKAWQRVLLVKAWFKWLVLLIAALVLAGATAALYIAENRHHGFKKHHHQHHDHDE